jgi:hypothetical protein
VLNVATILFLLIGAFHLLIGVLAPIVGLPPTIVGLSPETDRLMWGQTTADLLHHRVTTDLRTHHTIVIGGLLAGLGIVELGAAWFGLRAGQSWALLVLIGSGVAMLPFWWLMISQFTRAGVTVALLDLQPFVLIPAILLLPAALTGLLGIRQE